jgi:hypothetical protein
MIERKKETWRFTFFEIWEVRQLQGMCGECESVARGALSGLAHACNLRTWGSDEESDTGYEVMYNRRV